VHGPRQYPPSPFERERELERKYREIKREIRESLQERETEREGKREGRLTDATLAVAVPQTGGERVREERG